MMTKTHAALSVAITSFAMGTADPGTLAIAAGASLLPDVDTTKSLAGRALFPVARFLENRFAHRTITHSFVATGVVALLALPLRWALAGAGAIYWRALVFGFFFGWFGDVFTKSGVAAFYPFTAARLVVPRNPRLRLSTGTKGEYLVYALLVCAGIAGIHLNTAGGLMRAFGNLMGQPESAITLFQKEGARHQVLVALEGRNAATGQRVDMSGAEVVDVDGDTLIVRDAGGAMFQVGAAALCSQCQIQAERIRAKTGAPIETESRELRFEDREMRDVIAAIPQTPGARLVFSGELTLKGAHSLVLSQSLQRFNPVTISGADGANERKVRLRAAGIDDLAPLSDSYGSGNLLIKVVKYGGK